MSARRDPWLDADVDRFSIFVPALMSAGLLFSIVTLLRDAARARRHRHSDRRVQIAAVATAEHVLSGRPASAALAQALRPRITYLITSLSCLAIATYVTVGAVGNYGRPGGYLSDIAWLLAVSLVSSLLLLWIAVGAGMIFARFPRTPAWATELILSTPLGQSPDADDEPSVRRFLLGWSAVVAAGTFAVITLGVGSARGAFQSTDQRLLTTIEDWSWLERFGWANVLGRSEVAIAIALVVGVATLRCLPFAAAYLASVLASFGLSVLVRVMVGRDRPPGTTFTGMQDSFPSGHVAQVVLLAGLLPLAVLVLTGRRYLAWATGVVAAGAAGLAALLRVHHSLHWPTDVLGSVALGIAMVLVVRWSLEHPSLHARCHGCPWSPTAGPAHTVVHLERWLHGPLRVLSLGWALVGLALFTALAATEGVPRNPDGGSVGAVVEVGGTFASLGLLALAWLLALRWPAAGAFGLAFGGLVLGALSSVAYHPAVSLLVAASFGVPAVGMWLSWQHERTRRSLVVLAAITVASLLGVYATADAVNEHFFGPAHPVSDTAALPIEHVEWAWSGAVTTEGFEVVARVVDDDRSVALVALDDGEVVARSEAVPVPDSRVVRLAVDGLGAGRSYTYAVEVDGDLDDHRGRGQVTTAPEGPADLRLAVGSCARTGTTGEVFDAIRAVDPDLYVITGDIHYGNPAIADPGLFRTLISEVVSAPAQAALYREVPVAYVWDDHDYGPNDADSTSPTQETARAAYRELVPSHAALTGAINQAFSMGRVRVVMTDTRSARTDESMLGAEQLAWLLDELETGARTHALVIWVNSVPWIAEPDPERDDWGAYDDERQEILAHIDEAGIDNLVMLSGDAHMVALDDGTNSGGFPVLHAAALDRPGNVKGGPYSDGAYPGAGQFGVVDVRDDGGEEIEVTLTGRTWAGEVLVSRTFEMEVPLAAG